MRSSDAVSCRYERLYVCHGMMRDMTKQPLTTSQSETARSMALELLTEANTRGDQDWEAVSWAVNYLLHRANESERANRAPLPCDMPA